MTILTRTLQILFILYTALAPMAGCSNEQVPGSEARVAKVDTAYIYEANIANHVKNWRDSQRTRLSNFIGFTPNEILHVREMAIISEIRKEIKRLPGVVISTQEKAELADRQVEELAREIHAELTADPDSFAELAVRYSEAPSANTGGQLQPFGVTENPEQYQSLAYTMNVGDISEPFSSWDGWRIVQLNEIIVDELSGTSYVISLILLTPDPNGAEAALIDIEAEEHTVEILDPKYNARRSILNEDFEAALASAEEALARNSSDDLAHYLAASALWELDRPEQAIDALKSAAESARVADGLEPYYQYFRGQYLKELERTDEAVEAFHAAYDCWQQDYTIGLALEQTFTDLNDSEYLAMIQEEITSIREQDRITRLFAAPDLSKQIIVTGGGTFSDISAVYEPGYRAND